MNIEQEKQAIRILKNFEPETEPYYLCYSGGKDSDVIKLLAKLAGVRYEAEHCLTTVDAPETVQYIKQQQDVHIALARYADGTHKTMWNLIVEKLFPPTRLVRYCCSELKEWGRALSKEDHWSKKSGKYETSEKHRTCQNYW